MSEFKQYKLIPDPDGFEPAVEVTFRQVQMARERLAELLGIDLNLIDPSTGTKLTPSPQGKECLGNGTWVGYECCCDECDYFLECFPEYDQ